MVCVVPWDFCIGVFLFCFFLVFVVLAFFALLPSLLFIYPLRSQFPLLYIHLYHISVVCTHGFYRIVARVFVLCAFVFLWMISLAMLSTGLLKLCHSEHSDMCLSQHVLHNNRGLNAHSKNDELCKHRWVGALSTVCASRKQIISVNSKKWRAFYFACSFHFAFRNQN